MKQLRITDAAAQLGAAPERRHRWWDVGQGVGLVCARCGIPKPRADAPGALPDCLPGSVVRTEAELRARRQTSLPSLLLACAWQGMLQDGFHVGPQFWQALHASAKAPLATLGKKRGRQELKRAIVDAQKVYQAVHQGVPATVHCLACCTMILTLVNSGLLRDPGHQAALISTAILNEAQDVNSDWPLPREGELGVLSDRMIRGAVDLGYFKDRLP